MPTWEKLGQRRNLEDLISFSDIWMVIDLQERGRGDRVLEQKEHEIVFSPCFCHRRDARPLPHKLLTFPKSPVPQLWKEGLESSLEASYIYDCNCEGPDPQLVPANVLQSELKLELLGLRGIESLFFLWLFLEKGSEQGASRHGTSVRIKVLLSSGHFFRGERLSYIVHWFLQSKTFPVIRW